MCKNHKLKKKTVKSDFKHAKIIVNNTIFASQNTGKCDGVSLERSKRKELQYNGFDMV